MCGVIQKFYPVIVKFRSNLVVSFRLIMIDGLKVKNLSDGKICYFPVQILLRRAGENNVPLLFVSLICFHDDIIKIKVCNRLNLTQVGFVHMYELCFLLTHDFFFVTCLCHSTAKS